MPPTAMSRIGSLTTPETEEASWEQRESRKQERRMRDAIRSHCRDQLETCVSDRDSAMTQQDVEQWMQSMEEAYLEGETEEEKTRNAQELAGHYAQRFIRQTKEAGAIIARAEHAGWILPSKAAEWRARMKIGSWEEKKDFITGQDTAENAHTLRAFARNWEQIATEYKHVLELEKKLSITKEDRAKYAELSEFHHPNMMSGKLNYWDRKRIIKKADDFLKTFKPGMKTRVKEGKEELAVRARTELMKAVRAKALDEGKGMYWLETKVLCKAPKELEKYIEVDLKAYVINCVKTRVEFDHVSGQMEKQGVPQGFHRLSPTKFLALTLNQRKSYVRMAQSRLQETHGNTHPEMDNLKLGIRHALDTKDWEEAEDMIKKGYKLLDQKKGKDSDRTDLRSMENYLRDFREKEKTKKRPQEDVRETLQQMRAAFEQIPSSFKPLYLGAMEDSYECLCRLNQIIYNREWVTTHGYCDESREKILEQAAKQETPMRAKGEHGKRGLENIHLGAVAAPQHGAAVRSYTDGEWAPTYIHMPPGSQGKLLSIVKARKDNHAFGYWTTLIPTDVSYESQLNLIHNVNWVLKSGMRKLQKAGMRFTLTGEPLAVN